VKDQRLLHPELARTVAAAGHGDLIGLADAGLPIPLLTARIDLAFSPGKPALLDVLDAVLSELVVEAYVLAEESAAAAPWLVEALAARLPDAQVEWRTHEALKAATHEARAVVRTGEFRPFANVLLRSGVRFPG